MAAKVEAGAKVEAVDRRMKAFIGCTAKSAYNGNLWIKHFCLLKKNFDTRTLFFIHLVKMDETMKK